MNYYTKLKISDLRHSGRDFLRIAKSMSGDDKKAYLRYARREFTIASRLAREEWTMLFFLELACNKDLLKNEVQKTSQQQRQ